MNWLDAVLVLVLVAGVTFISYVVSDVVSYEVRRTSYSDSAANEYRWLFFRRTMLTGAAIVATVYGFTHFSDIIESITRLVRG